MLKLIYYQFQYSKKQWLGTIPVLFVSSLVVGTALNGIFSIMKNTATLRHVADPSPLFEMIVFFGGMTLFLLISGLLQFLISIFKEDYQLWAILGANRSQLSLLIGGQLFIIAFIVSALGTVLSVFLTQQYYAVLQSFVGEKFLPAISISFDGIPFLLSLFTVPLIAGIGGYYFSRRILKKESLADKGRSKKIQFSVMIKGLLNTLVFVMWVSCLFILFSKADSKSAEANLTRLSAIVYMLLLNLVVIQLLSPYLQILLIRLGSRLYSKSGYAFILAKWNILQKPAYLKTLQSSLTMGIILISGFLLLSQNISARFQADSVTEMKISFLSFLAAPILVILANVISITILSSSQDKKDIRQLRILGASKKSLIFICLAEGVLHAAVAFIVSLLFNLIIFAMVLYGVHILGFAMLSYTAVFSIDLLVSAVLLVFIFVTKGLMTLSSTYVAVQGDLG